MAINQAANDFAKFLNTDVDVQLKPMIETIDDMLTRLEEFEALVAMVQGISDETVGEGAALTKLSTEFYEGLALISTRTDSLEVLVERVRADLNSIETLVQTAENDLKAENKNKFKTLLKPFLKPSPGVRFHGKKMVPVQTFNPDEYFPK